MTIRDRNSFRSQIAFNGVERQVFHPTLVNVVQHRDAETAVRLLYPYRRNVLTITTDNGSEFARHGIISELLNAPVFFADSYSSWQKGAIENTNKLIRQYIPKGTDFKGLTDEYVHSVQLQINRRPREKLNFSTPKDEFFKYLL